MWGPVVPLKFVFHGIHSLSYSKKNSFFYKTVEIKRILRSQYLWTRDFFLSINNSDLYKQDSFCLRVLCACLTTALSKAGTCTTIWIIKDILGKHICDWRSFCLFVYSCIAMGRVTLGVKVYVLLLPMANEIISCLRVRNTKLSAT